MVEQAAEVAAKFIESPPMTLAAQRVVVLPAVAVLAEHLEEFAAPEPDGLVFPSGRGTYLVRVERAKGIEPSPRAWEARVLPLNYARRRGDSSRAV